MPKRSIKPKFCLLPRVEDVLVLGNPELISAREGVDLWLLPTSCADVTCPLVLIWGCGGGDGRWRGLARTGEIYWICKYLLDQY